MWTVVSSEVKEDKKVGVVSEGTEVFWHVKFSVVLIFPCRIVSLSRPQKVKSQRTEERPKVKRRVRRSRKTKKSLRKRRRRRSLPWRTMPKNTASSS